VLNNQAIPARLPDPAADVLRALRWDGAPKRLHPQDHWMTTLRDTPRHGTIHDAVRVGVTQLKPRIFRA
jgi:acetoin utilization protein AcuC